MVSAGQQMTLDSEQTGKIMVSHGQQMTEQSEKAQPSNTNTAKDNMNYNSRKNFLRGEATLEPVATDSNVNQTQSIVNEQLDPPDSR